MPERLQQVIATENGPGLVETYDFRTPQMVVHDFETHEGPWTINKSIKKRNLTKHTNQQIMTNAPCNANVPNILPMGA